MVRLTNAIQAHTRALLGADRYQTPLILSKLAMLHTSLSQHEEAISYHRKILQLGERVGTPEGELAASYLAVAEWEMRTGEGTGDLALAAQYLEKVSQTNAPQRDRAEEALRELRTRELRSAARLA
jgi:anaphase-promoting complex subunit 8